jgi:Rieske Fe-S protein
MSKADTAKWREDFPVTRGADNYVTRREFTKFLVMTSGAIAAGNGYFVIRQLDRRHGAYPKVKIASAGELAAGATKLFRYPTEDDPAILIRLDETRFAAFRQRCTHLSCPVIFNHAKASLDCPCHNGSFDASSGAVLGGPPPSPLPRIALRIENGDVYADGIEEPHES